MEINNQLGDQVSCRWWGQGGLYLDGLRASGRAKWVDVEYQRGEGKMGNKMG